MTFATSLTLAKKVLQLRIGALEMGVGMQGLLFSLRSRVVTGRVVAKGFGRSCCVVLRLCVVAVTRNT